MPRPFCAVGLTLSEPCAYHASTERKDANVFSFTHIAIVFIVALLVFGPEKLPEVARIVGKALGDFRKASTDFRRVVETEFAEIERQAREKEEREKQKALAASTPASAPLLAQGAATAEGAASSAPTAPADDASAVPGTEASPMPTIAPPGSVANSTVHDSGAGGSAVHPAAENSANTARPEPLSTPADGHAA